MTHTNTPAPWSVHHDDDGVEIRGRGDMMGCIINGNEMDCNARLIESAPELLAFVQKVTGGYGGTEAMDEAFRLIAKATGHWCEGGLVDHPVHDEPDYDQPVERATDKKEDTQ